MKAMEQYLVIRHNRDGRPCGWGLSPDESAARAEATRQYEGHSCYPGETVGETITHRIPAGK